MILSVAVATLVALLTGMSAWFLDQRYLEVGSRPRAVLAVALIGLSAWLVGLILTAIWLEVPGAYGPVQFWGDSPAALDFMRGPRVWAMFLALGGLPLAAVTLGVAVLALFLRPFRRRWWRLLVPGSALGLYAFAIYLISHYGFTPRA